MANGTNQGGMGGGNEYGIQMPTQPKATPDASTQWNTGQNSYGGEPYNPNEGAGGYAGGNTQSGGIQSIESMGGYNVLSGMQPQQQNIATGQGYFQSSGPSMYQFGSGGYSPNPYLGQQADAIKTSFNRNLSENTLPGLRDKFVGSGGLGGSRQGIAEGLAAARSNEGLANAVTNLYAQDYENSQNRGLQAAIAGNNASLQAQSLGMQNELARLNSDRGFYSTNRGQDLQQLGLAQGLLGAANAGFSGLGQGLYGLGTLEQQAPWQQLQNYNGLLAPYTQAGATNTGSQSYTYNPTQQWLGTAAQVAGPLAAIFSDERLKEDVKRIGKTDDGLGVYTYKYLGDDKTQMGVMAQEVAKKKPEALGPTIGGFHTVRYGLLG